MTEDDLIAFALSLPEATEGMHFGTRDFRVRTKIFLTLPNEGYCVVKLTQDQQAMALELSPTSSCPFRAAGASAAGQGCFTPSPTI